MKFKLTIAIIAIALVGIFVVQNMEVVQVEFLLWNLEASRVIIYLTVFLMGIFTGWLGKSLRML